METKVVKIKMNMPRQANYTQAHDTQTNTAEHAGVTQKSEFNFVWLHRPVNRARIF